MAAAPESDSGRFPARGPGGGARLSYAFLSMTSRFPHYLRATGPEAACRRRALEPVEKLSQGFW